MTKTEGMEDNVKMIETLLERATEYGKTSIDLVKLRALDKASDVVSSFVPNAITFAMILTFLLFFNLGLAFWLGGILGKTFYGFITVAAFYAIIALVLRLFMHKWIKRIIYNSIIKKVLN
jgi:hypothetical protein